MRTKIYFFALVILWSISGFGQIGTQAISVDPSNQINQLHSVFSNLEKNRIPTGLLLDAAVESANLKKYDGTMPDSSYTSSKLVLDVYNTLVLSRLSANAQISKAPEQFISDWKAEQQIDIIPLGGVFYKYAQFSEATQQNAQNTGDPGTLTINNGKVEDKYINGVWQNPYEEKQVFALAPAINSSNKFNFKIKLPDHLFLSNQTSQIQKIEYRLSDDLPYQLLPYNQLIDAAYTSEGTYHWTFKLTLNSGQVLYSHTQFVVDGNLDQYVDITGIAAKGSNLDQYSKYVVSIGGNKATLYIKLAPGHSQIIKPLIVAEGFDMGAVITPSREAGLTNIESFVKRDLYGYYPLASELNDNYDIIYVDWNNGVDYIQNNAALLVKAIQWVNDNKAGTIQNVVLGQSMGGLVARYALKDMEDKGIAHNTKLFISQDSPHLGANIPIGIQYMLRNVTNKYITTPIIAGIGEFIVPIFNQGISVSDILTLPGTPAARQMLINYVTSNYQIDNTIHNNWQNELKAKGYPQLTRNVAISNGSECGTDQNIQDLLTIYKETGNQHLFSDIIGVVVGVATLRLDMILLAALPGSSKYVFDFKAQPMININENKQIYKGNIKYKKKILWLINAQVTLLNGSRNQPSNILPIDKYGGGKFMLAYNELPDFIKDNLTITPFSFIPTPSAIDYKFGNITLGESEYQRAYSPVDDKFDVPFANFVAEKMDANNMHISFSSRNGQFILNQLSNSTTTQNETLTTSYLCGSKVKIGGEGLLCGNDDVTYTTGFAPTIQWTVLKGSNLIDMTSPANQPQISFTPKSNANGLVRLQAYLAGGGSSNTVTKDVWIGKPIFDITQINDPTYYNESHFYVDGGIHHPIESQGITGIKWTKLSSNPSTVRLFALQNHTESWAMGDNNSWTMDLKVEVTNACGTTEYTALIFPPAALPCDNYSLAKDGTSSDSYAVVHIIEPPCDYNRTVTAKQGDQYNIVVANSMGVIVINKTGDTFDLQGFPTGTYVVNITKDNQTIINQTLIKNY